MLRPKRNQLTNLTQRGFCFLLLAVLLLPSMGLSTAADAEVFNEGSGYLSLPPGLDPASRYPLLVVLSPSGNPDDSLDKWESIAEELNVIIFASKDYRNGKDMKPLLEEIAAKIPELAMNYAIDETKVIFAGLSGGGMGSHAFSYSHPEKLLGIIVNTGMMHEIYKSRTDYTRNKKIVFLASPTDFRYDEMQSDRQFLEKLGWQINWLEFAGGHTHAPEKLRKEALAWLLNN